MTFQPELSHLDRLGVTARRQVEADSPAFPIGEEPVPHVSQTHAERIERLTADALRAGATEDEIAIALSGSPEA